MVDFFIKLIIALASAIFAGVKSSQDKATTEKRYQEIKDAQDRNDVEFRDLDSVLAKLRNQQGKRPDAGSN